MHECYHVSMVIPEKGYTCLKLNNFINVGICFSESPLIIPTYSSILLLSSNKLNIWKVNAQT